ncbi:hypothetical protein AB0A66_33615, partial [Streptomyces longwoodensis]
PATAVRLAKEMAPFKPAWLEEPVPPENLKALDSRVPAPAAFPAAADPARAATVRRAPPNGPCCDGR